MAEPASVADDKRWKAFNAKGFACSCGETHVGLFPIHMHHPINWPGSKDYERDEDIRLEGDFLSANICVWEGRFFALRTRLFLEMAGAQPAAFLFTAWASLNRDDFIDHLNAMNSGKLDNRMRTQARLVNRLSGYADTSMLMGSAFQQEDRGPPLLIIHGPQAENDPNHPLIHDQRHGIGVDKMLELFAHYGHDMRPAATRV